MNNEIKEMFDYYSSECISNAYRLLDFYSSVGFGFIIFTRSYKDSMMQKERLENLKVFYDSLEESKDLKEARKKSGFNQKQAKYYINFLNAEFKKRTNNTFFDAKIRVRNRGKDVKLIAEDEFIDFLESIDIEAIKTKITHETPNPHIPPLPE